MLYPTKNNQMSFFHYIGLVFSFLMDIIIMCRGGVGGMEKKFTLRLHDRPENVLSKHFVVYCIVLSTSAL